MHLAQHRRFSEQVVALRAEARRGTQDSRDALLVFLKDWLTNHILTTDKRLGQFICSNGRSQEIAAAQSPSAGSRAQFPLVNTRSRRPVE
jgi:hemerythrin